MSKAFPRHPSGFPRDPQGFPRDPKGVPRDSLGFPRDSYFFYVLLCFTMYFAMFCYVLLCVFYVLLSLSLCFAMSCYGFATFSEGGVASSSLAYGEGTRETDRQRPAAAMHAWRLLTLHRQIQALARRFFNDLFCCYCYCYCYYGDHRKT